MISIIIPTFNRGTLLGNTLDSVIKQSYPNWECIVVDDGSTDYTPELMEFYCRSFPSIKYISRPESLIKGANTCRNIGFKESNGNYIKWFDSDDILCADALEKQVEHLQLKEELDVSMSYAISFENRLENQWEAKPSITVSKDVVFDYLVGNLFFSVGGGLWRKEFLNVRKISFNEKLFKLQDTEFHYRLLLQGLKFEFLEKPVVMYRRGHSDRITTRFDYRSLISAYDYYFYTLKTAECLEQSNVVPLKLHLINTINQLYCEVIRKQGSFIKRGRGAIYYGDRFLNGLQTVKVKKYCYLKSFIGIIITIFFKGRGAALLQIKRQGLRSQKERNFIYK